MNSSCKTAFILSILSFSALSCAQHDIPVDVDCLSNDVVSYSDDVESIVISNCAISGCHNGDNGADRNWTDFAKFQAKASEVRRRITLPADHEDHMPRSGNLTSAEIQTIICWVDQGALDN